MPVVSLPNHPKVQLAGGVSAFDLGPAQDAVRRKYGRDYHRMDAALWDVAALWGIAPEHERINPVGVFWPFDEVVRIDAARSFAEIKLANAPGGLWAATTDYHLPNSGKGSAPSVWNRFAFLSRDDARQSGLAELQECMLQIERRGGVDAKAAIVLFNELGAAQSEQLALF